MCARNEGMWVNAVVISVGRCVAKQEPLSVSWPNTRLGHRLQLLRSPLEERI
jgi:hypothetical protein